MSAAAVPRLKLYVDDDGATEEQLREIGERAYEAKPVMRVIQGLMADAAIEQFESEGSRGGFRWKPDKEPWSDRKKREGHSPDTEVETGDLREAMIAKTGGGNAIRRLSKNSTTVGVRMFYAAFQGHNRQLLILTVRDQDNYATRMIEWILEGRL